MKIYALLPFLFATSVLLADSPQRYSRIRLLVPDKITLDRIWKGGLDFEGASGKIGGPMEFIAGPFELAELDRLGLTYTIVRADLAAESAAELSRVPASALGFGYGSMGGYYTFFEVVAQLDSM